MSVSTYPKYGINPQPTEAELEKAREIIAEAKKRAKANPPKTAQEAWAKFEEVREKIIESVKNKDN